MDQRTGRCATLRAKHVAIAVAAAFAPWAHGQTPPPANTLPTGGVITQGSGTIHAPVHAPSVSTLQIDQASARMAAQFGSFSIGQSAHVNVSQPSSSSVALFKDVGGSRSQIYGGLTANGQIFISNQNGVLFGSTARVEVGSLFATNLSINETDFMEGRYNWYNDGATGTVTNQGTIITPSGYTVLAGPQVRNDGVIIARTGTVVLAAGDRVALDLIGDGLISVSVDQAALNASAINTGTINADGGTVMLTARSANALLDTVVNSGVIRATSLIERNGEIVLDAGPSGTVYATGETQATQVSVRGGGLRVERLVPDPMFLNGMIAGDTINVDVTDAVLVERGGQMTSRFGQSITAGSLTIRGLQPGEFSTVRNESGNQAITVTGADGILVEATNGGGAILGKPFIFGVPATDSQTISATRIQVQGGSIQANEQNITVSGDFSLRNGAASTLGGNQTITVNGGNVDLRGASISSGAAQSITVTGGDHISVVGEAGFAGLQASFGPQTVSITGAGANAINIDGATVNGLNQTITAGNPGELGSITITGSSHSNGFSHIANIGVGVANPQTVRTSGTLSITGGSARAAGIFQNNPAEQRISAASVVLQGGPSGSGNGAFINSTFGGGQLFNVPGEIRLTGGVGGAAGIFNGTNTPLPGTNTPQTNSAPQTINAGSVVLQGGAGGSGNGAFINSTFGGNQTLTVPGEIRVTGGDGGTGNRAGIITNANQTIDGNPHIVLRGGNGGGAGNASNNVVIQATGDDTKVQTINARSVEIRSGAGTDASATFNAARQAITTAGNVSLYGGGGDGPVNGVRIGGIGGTTLGPTNLTLNVGGNLLLRGGTANGASLGSSGASTQANTISVTAGNITLESEGAGARIGANATASPVNPGTITVTAGGDLNVGSGTGIRATGSITLTANSLTNDGTISNGGGASTANMILNADRFDLDGGNIQGGNAAVILRPRTGTNSFGIEAPGATTLTNADLAKINTTNFVVLGSGMGTTFTGTMTIGETAPVQGAGKSLAFFRSNNPGGDIVVGTHGVTTTGDVIIGAGGGAIRSSGGTVAGDEAILRASQGIGAAGNLVETAVSALAIGNTGGAGVFVREAGDVTLRSVALNVGGIINNQGTSTGNTALDLTTGGALNVAGQVFTGPLTINAGGGLNVAGAGTQDAIISSVGGQAITAQSLNVSARDGRLAHIANSGSGSQAITTGALSVGGGSALANATLSGVIQNAGDAQTINASSVLVQGTDAGANNGIFIRAASGDQSLTVTGDITIAAGAGGEAWIQGSPNGRQTIHARDITMTNGVGGNNSFAALQAGHQEIHASGDVRLTGGATGSTNGGVRMGGLRNATVATATDLRLLVGGDLVLTGGSAPNNFAGIGSTGAFGVANDIYIEAGSVILNPGVGTGARIGHGTTPGGGTIEIHAVRGIELNGTTPQSATTIRSLGNVALDAASISQAASGFIAANTLTTTTSGNASLTGPNRVASFSGTSLGDLNLANTRALNVTGLSASNAALTNAGDVTVSGTWNSSTASITTTGAGSDLTVNGAVTSSGVMNVNVAGDIAVTAGAGQDAMLRSFGGQTISGRSVAVTSNGGFARVWNTGPNAQTINVSDGAGVDVQTLASGGFAQISADAGGNQTINVLNGDHINVNGAMGGASIFNFGGTQTVSITGAESRNAITVGSAGSLGPSTIRGGVQNITAGASGQSGSISIVGGDANQTFTGFSSGQIIGGTQTLSTSGTLRISGGSAPNQPPFGFATGLFHNGSGEQRVSAANMEMQGGASGVNNTAIIISSGGAGTIAAGNQVIDVTGGSIELTGGIGTSNTAIIVSLANQTVTAGSVELRGGNGISSGAFVNAGSPSGSAQLVTVSGAIAVEGGSGTNNGAGIFQTGTGPQTVNAASIDLRGGASGTNSGAFINVTGGGVAANAGTQAITVSGDIDIAGGAGGNAGILGSAARQQTILAEDIRLTNSAGGGINSVGFIQGGHQQINASGDVLLEARASGGDLPGVRIGGLAGNNPTATDLTLNVGRDLILTGGTAPNNGVGIGSTAASGVPPLRNDITINAGRDVTLNSGVATSGVRIGSPQAGAAQGSINITAGGNINLNGVNESASIRTLGTATLHAASITEATRGRIIAGTLDATAHNSMSLAGPNEVASFRGSSTNGDLTFNNPGSFAVTSLSASGNATLTSEGALTLAGPWSSTAATISAGSIATAGGGSINATNLTTVSTGSTTLDGANQVVTYNGTSVANLTFNNAAALHVTGVNAAGAATLTAGGAMTISGPVAANGVVLTANGVLDEVGGGAIVANSLTTFSTADTSLNGANQVTSFNATSTAGDVSLNNTVRLDVTGMSAFGDASISNIGDVTVSGPWMAGGTSTITVGSDILLNAAMVSEHVVLTANDGAIIQAPTASIVAETLTTSSTGDTLLDGFNEVETVSFSSTSGDIRLTNSSPLLSLASISLPGELLVRHTGAVDVRGDVSALAHTINATGDVTVGSADAQSATLLYAPGDISISTPGSIIVRGSDTTAGASSAVLADGHLRFSAGNVSLVAGDAALTPVVVRGGNGVEMTVGNELRVTGGGGLLSPALLTSGRDINLTIGSAVRVDGGSGLLSLARIQTETEGGVIRLVFPNLSEGGYFVNGIEGRRHDHDSGFYSVLKAAKIGKTLLLEYGN